jgi:hypothetical protein
MAVMANYTSRSSFFYCLLHVKGEEVFGSAKRPTNCPPNVNNDSHCHDYVNLSRPQIIVHVAQLNIVRNVACSNRLMVLVLVYL